MHPDRVREILDAVRVGTRSVDEAARELAGLGFEDLGFAKVDHHRSLRRGFPEVIFGPGKTPQQVEEIATRLAGSGQVVLVTKTTEDAFAAVQEKHPGARWNAVARAIVVGDVAHPQYGPAAVLSAGTSDIPIAEEAALTAELFGSDVKRIFDVGVAGLHRLLSHREVLEKARVLVVVAGMDGALPAVVSGLVSSPVIAVPTSIGYGASFSGVAALLAMLNGCSPGVSVVNIDNGFGAGYLAGVLSRMGVTSRADT